MVALLRVRAHALFYSFAAAFQSLPYHPLLSFSPREGVRVPLVALSDLLLLSWPPHYGGHPV